jgi:hypothetical protein
VRGASLTLLWWSIPKPQSLYYVAATSTTSSVLAMSDQPPTTVIGCLLDVSDSRYRPFG